MNPRGPAVLTAGILIAVAAVDLPRVGIALSSPARLILLAGLGLAGLAATVRWPAWWRFLRRPETALLTASFAWVLLVSPLGRIPIRGALVAAALFATVLLGIIIGRTLGWSWFADLVGPIILVLLLGATVYESASAEGGRWSAWAEEANGLATIAALGVILGVSARLDRRWWLAPLVPLGLLILVLTDARIPTIAAVVGSIVALRPRLGRGTPPAVISAGLLLVAFLVAAGVAGSGLLEPERFEEISSLNGRTRAWDIVIEEIAQNPLTGIGPEATQDFLVADPTRVTWGPTHAHNAPLQMGLHGGWPAAILFVAATIAYWMTARRAPVASRDGVMLALLLIGITEHLVREPTLPLLVMAVAAGSVATDAPDRPIRTGLRWPLPRSERRHDLVEVSQ